MSLNANTPTLVGCEWSPTRQRGLKLDNNRRVAALFTPGATTCDDAAVYLKNIVGAPVMNAELIKVSDISASPVVTTDAFNPTADGGSLTESATVFLNGAASTGTCYTAVDDYPGVNTVDGIKTTGTSLASWLFTYTTGAYSTSKRVTRVGIHVVGKTTDTANGGNTVVTPAIGSGLGTSQSIGLTQTQLDFYLTTNPQTGQPFTVADVQGFASSTQVGINISGPSAGGFALYTLWITVDSVPETRLAFGSATAGATDGWLTIPMATPLGVDTWTPTAATLYALILSAATSGASCSWAALDSGSVFADYANAAVTVSTLGFPSALGITDTGAPALVMLDGSGNALLGQPYALIIEEEVNAVRVIQQEVTLPDTQSRGWVRFVARQSSLTTNTPLVARLKRRSDNVQIGGDITVNAFDVRNAPRLPQQISMAAASGAAATAAQHYIEWSNTGVAGLGWLLTTLSTESATYATVGVGGTTDAATLAGSRTTTRDVPVLVGITRTSPAGLSVVAA